jgi:signal transduction histidine kinase/CheY-like chemotaxis protein
MKHLRPIVRQRAAIGRWLAVWLAIAPASIGVTLAQNHVTLVQAEARAGSDATPALEGREVTVEGQVSLRSFWTRDGSALAIQDSAGYGLLLLGAPSQLESFGPGDWIAAAGTIEIRAGLPVLIPREIHKTGDGPPPKAAPLRTSDLAQGWRAGSLVTIEGTVEHVGEAYAGEIASIGGRGDSMNIVLPKARHDTAPGLDRFKAGDRIRVTGLAGQACPIPPYDRCYQVLVPSASFVALVERAWLLPPSLLLSALISIMGVLGIWWIRERRMASQRRRMRMLNSLAEEVIASGSPSEILRKLSSTLPQLSKDALVSLYLYNRGSKTLESVQTGADGDQSPVKVDSPTGPLASGLALCVRNRTLIPIPDTRRSPFFKDENRPGSPRSVMFVPMLAQTELLGVLQLEYSDRLHYFTQEEQASMQHLANQAATALKLQGQQSIREQLFRSEKLAAAGQLISGVATELRSPLESIINLASSLISMRVDGRESDLRMIGTEAQRAAEIVSRLVSFAKIEKAEAQAVDVNGLLAGLLEFRARELKQKSVEVRQQLCAGPLVVLGSRGQIEQVLLNLLVDAEQAAAEAKEKLLTITSGQLARRLLIEIVYQTRPSELQKQDTFDQDYDNSTALGLSVCRGIIQSHGGDFRSFRASHTQARFEIELPVVEGQHADGASPSAGRRLSRSLTVLVVDPDTRTQRQIVRMLGNRGDRAVPSSSAEEGADLVQRVRFDMIVCSARLHSWNWIEFFERVRHQVTGFVLLTDGFDADLARVFQGSEGFVLPKPVDEADLHRVCHAVEERSAVQL